jgi:hypothetical protein
MSKYKKKFKEVLLSYNGICNFYEFLSNTDAFEKAQYKEKYKQLFLLYLKLLRILEGTNFLEYIELFKIYNDIIANNFEDISFDIDFLEEFCKNFLKKSCKKIIF